jgi:hypothetical protein
VHLFVFDFAIMACVTPLVALAAGRPDGPFCLHQRRKIGKSFNPSFRKQFKATIFI